MIRTLGIIVTDNKNNNTTLAEYIADSLDYLKKDALLDIAYENDVKDISKSFSKSKIIDAIMERLEYFSNDELFNFLDKNKIGVSRTMINNTLDNYINIRKLCDKEYYSRNNGWNEFTLYKMQDYVDMIMILESILPTTELPAQDILSSRYENHRY